MTKPTKTPVKHRTFADLPGREQALIRSCLNALNRAKSPQEADKLALNHRGDDARPLLKISPAPSLVPQDPSDVIPPDASMYADNPEAAKESQAYWQHDMTMLRERLTALARKGRLPPLDVFDDLITTFEAGVRCEPEVQVFDHYRRTRIVKPVQFTNASAAAAFCVLRLAELNSKHPPVVCCLQCQTFTLVEETAPSAGRRASKFCSTKCRNLFGQRKYRRELKAKAARRHK